VSSLKEAQVEYETMRYEVKRLIDDADILQSANEEANKLKEIAVRQVGDMIIFGIRFKHTCVVQVEEALQSLQQEREMRLALKKELEALKNQDHMNQLNSMFSSMVGLPDDHDDDENAIKTLESSFNNSGHKGGHDLFSEVHGDMQVNCEF
jgi:hypothetical protein